jgi:hypothetical protein
VNTSLIASADKSAKALVQGYDFGEPRLSVPKSFSGAPNALAMAFMSMSAGTGNSPYNWAKTSAAILLKSSMFGAFRASASLTFDRRPGSTLRCEIGDGALHEAVERGTVKAVSPCDCLKIIPFEMSAFRVGAVPFTFLRRSSAISPNRCGPGPSSAIARI